MNKRIKELAEKSGMVKGNWANNDTDCWMEGLNNPNSLEKFSHAIIAECIDKIETYRIPVGNSASGELACEWTYDALKEIRDDIKETFGVDI